MQPVAAPITRDLLLIGGGHAHALLLRMWGMAPLPGARLTLVNPGPTTAYTGMLPGFVAGRYSRDALDIDLVRLARFAGARWVLDHVIGLDPAAGLARLAGRPPIAFDIASIDIGVTTSIPFAGGAERVWPAKPMDAFADAWEAFVASVAAGQAAPSAAVVGGGLGGAELAMAMAARLAAVAADHRRIRTTLVESAAELAPHAPPGLRRRLSEALARAGVTVATGQAAVAGDPQTLTLASGAKVEAAFIASAAGAAPAAWLAGSGLALHQGFIRVDAALRSHNHANIFAVGDVAHLDASPRPKAGVYAVRQAPVLYDNLRAALSGGRLRRFHPQDDYLKLVGLGDGSALAEKWGVTAKGRGLWRWKDQIDRRFMRRLGELPPMAPPPARQGPSALGVTEIEREQPLCGGCGSKVGPLVLRSALSKLAPPARSDVLTGRGDDAAILAWGTGEGQVVTTDHVRAFTHDPYLLAQIAANHALGDVWAMGAEPQAALLSLSLPPMSTAKQAQTLQEILAGVEAVLREAGADLVGGHTSLGAELTLGLTVTGLLGERPGICLGGARIGDRLVLTKPIGTGVILAAEMRGLARGRDVAEAFAQMRRSLGPAAKILRDAAHAMTDVTGFGLAGHVLTMAERSGVGAILRLGAAPWASGAVALAEARVRSSLYPENLRLAASMDIAAGLANDPRLALLFDPQTAGGLLAALTPADAADVLGRLTEAGEPAWIVGEVTPTMGGLQILA